LTDEEHFTTNIAIHYTPEFKQALVDLHEKGRSFKELHEEYGTAVTNEQFKQLQKENRRLREELNILTRTAVLLAKRWS